MNKSWNDYNPNPETQRYIRGRRKGRKIAHSDCVVRAFTILFDMNWKDTYMKLAMRGIEKNDIFTTRTVWESFLDKAPISLNVRVNKAGDIRKTRKMTVKEVAKLTEGNSQVFLCSCLHHVVVCKEGQYFDSWDSGSEAVRSLWQLKPEYA